MPYEEWEPGEWSWVPDGSEYEWLDEDPDPPQPTEEWPSSQYMVEESRAPPIVQPQHQSDFNSVHLSTHGGFAAAPPVAVLPRQVVAIRSNEFAGPAPAPPIVSDPTDAEALAAVDEILRDRPHQQAANRLSNWYKRWEGTDKAHRKLKWVQLELKDQQRYTRSFLKTNFYKNLAMKFKEPQRTYCELVLRGTVVEHGRRGITGPTRKRPVDQKTPEAEEGPVATFTGVAFMVTMYPEVDLAADKYGPAVYRDVEAAALAASTAPELVPVIARSEAWVVTTLTAGDKHQRWTLKGELCPERWLQGAVVVHLHVQLHKQNLQIFTLTSALKFFGKSIHIRRCHIDRRSAQQTIERGHYYLHMPKPGSLFARGNFLAGEAYAIRSQWVTYYVAKGQLSFEAAEEEFEKCVADASKNILNLKFLKEAKTTKALRAQRDIMEIRLQKTMKTPKICKHFLDWQKDMRVDLEDDELQGRFKFVVFDGPAKTGKSQYVRMQYPVGALLELDCSGRNLYPDLKQFVRPRHTAILYDEGTPEMVLQQKLVFQSSNAWCTLGNSPCNRDVYHRWFYGTHQIICSNTWTADLAKIYCWEDFEWLDQNSIVISVQHGTFFDL